MDDDRRAAERAEDAALVARARGDDPDAFGRLYDRWFDRVHDLAYRITRDDSAASDVAQDAFVSAWKNLGRLEKPEAFGGWLLRITRNGALDRKRRDARATPVDDEGLAVIEAGGPSPASAPAGFRVEDRTAAADDPARAVEDSELVALVWESAAALGDRDAEILDLGLRHGLTPAEVGAVVGLNRNAANQAVHRVRNRLKTAVEARVLWRSGEPVCEGLAAALAAEGVQHFGADAVRVATKHAQTCAECQERRQIRLEPSKMFVAIPVISLPLLKTKIAHALDNDGLPMGQSAALRDMPLPGSGRGPRARQMVIAAGVAVVVVIVGVGAFAEDIEEATTISVAHRTAPTTTAPDTTTTLVTLLPGDTVPGSTTPTTKAVVVFPGPAPDPGPTPAPGPTPGPAPTSPRTAPTSPPVPDPTADISVSRRGDYVTVTWSSTNGVKWSISGPGLSASSSSGTSGTLCPGGTDPRTGGCTTVNPATYTIRVTNAAGASVSRSASG
jgi:RNA polymerase sigma factor (sigma-70 family)